MKKVVIPRAGSYDRLQLEEHPDPRPGPGEVLIDVNAIGVNYADCIVRMGLYASAKEFVGWPITPGFEVAGTVIASGAGTDAPPNGTRVLAVTLFGGYSTRLSVPRHQVFALPERLSFAQGAAFPAVFLTAWYALFELAHPRAGSRMLVHSAAGGVGSALVQLGKLAGCHVVGVVGSSHKVEAVRALGADAVIDKSSENLWSAARKEAPEGYDVVLDANGVETLRQSYTALRSGGKLVVYGFHTMMPRQGGRPNWLKLAKDYLMTPRFDPLRLTNENKSVMAFNLSYLFPRTEVLAEAMGQLLGWLEQGRIDPPRVKEYPLERVAEAHRDLESGKTIGKLVLVP